MKTGQAVMVVALGAVLLAVACGDAPLVIQGTVIRCDAGTKGLTVRDERPPLAEVVLDYSGADMGAVPEVGDLVRAAYRPKDGRLVAIRVMNLTRQKELSK